MTILAAGHPPLKFHPFANLFPMLSEKELDDLGQDIRANGQVEAIMLHQGMVLDGRNRYTACGKLGLKVRIEVFDGSEREALNHVCSKNLNRRHLNDNDRLRIAANMQKLKLGANQHSNEGRPIGQPSQLLNDLTVVSEDAPLSQPERADLLKVSERSLRRADTLYSEKGSSELQQAFEAGKVSVSTAADIAEALPKDEQAEIARLSEKEILAKAKEIRKEKNEVRRKERSDEIRRLAEASTDLPTGQKFPLIYMDPPTKFDAGDSDRSTENHYPTMTEEEIAALPVSDLALDKAVLLIWTTGPWLAKTIRMIEAWGFEYKSNCCWDKETIGLGYWWQNQHEILIAATRGNPVIPENGSILGPSLYREKKTRHSAKPEYFREMIDRVPEWKDWPKVELFPRGELPPNWKGWGNEAKLNEQQSLGIESAEAVE